MNGKLARALRKDTNERGQYRARKAALKAQRRAGGQQPKALPQRKRRPRMAIKPTWPGTPNQAFQGRPLIVQRPIRALMKMRPGNQSALRFTHGGWPKHALDAAVLRGFL